MSEIVSFWMENKNCVGKTAAVLEDQSLVTYRDRYYVLQGGVALTKGGKPLRFSLSSLPPHWRRALKVEVQLPVPMSHGTDAIPDPLPQKRLRKNMEKPPMTEQKQESTVEKSADAASLVVKSPKKNEVKKTPQVPVVANCPYCNARHEMEVEKGKSGKPFFIACNKCAKEFAVRFIPVTIYQAQVAGFR